MPMNDAQLKALQDKVTHAMAEAQRILLQATNDINANLVPVVMDIQAAMGGVVDPPPIDPPPIDPPPIDPPPVTGVIRVSSEFGAPGTGLTRMYSGKDNGPPLGYVPPLTGQGVLSIALKAPNVPTTGLQIAITHGNGGVSHLRQYLLMDRDNDYDPNSPHCLVHAQTDACSLRLSAGTPGSGRIDLKLGAVYHMVVMNNPPGVPAEPGTFNIVAQWGNS